MVCDGKGQRKKKPEVLPMVPTAVSLSTMPTYSSVPFRALNQSYTQKDLLHSKEKMKLKMKKFIHALEKSYRQIAYVTTYQCPKLTNICYNLKKKKKIQFKKAKHFNYIYH